MPRPTKKNQQDEGFSIANMRDEFVESLNILVSAIRGQGIVTFNSDDFETELRTLVVKYGRGGQFQSTPAPISNNAPLYASTTPTPEIPYSKAADMLVAGYKFFEAQDYAQFFASVRHAYKSSDAPALMAALNEMNENSEIGMTVRASIDDDIMDSDVEDSEFYDEDSKDSEIEDSEDEDSEIEDSEDSEIEESESDDEDFSIEADTDPDDSETDTTSVPMGGTASADMESEKLETRAFLNKLTISGSNESLKKTVEAARQAGLFKKSA